MARNGNAASHQRESILVPVFFPIATFATKPRRRSGANLKTQTPFVSMGTMARYIFQALSNPFVRTNAVRREPALKGEAKAAASELNH